MSRNTAEPDAAGTDPRAAQEQITAYWDFRSPAYDREPGHAIQREPERRAWSAALSDLLPPAPADVLDVGTGTGFIALLLAALGHRVTGIDLSAGLLAVAREGARPAADHPRSRLPRRRRPRAAPAAGERRRGDQPAPAVDPDRPGRGVRHLAPPAPARGRVVAIDGLWHATRDARQPAATARPAAAPWREEWARRYTAAVQAHLPLFAADTFDPVVAAAWAAGFADVAVSNLAEVERAERARDPDRRPSQPRYVVTARLA
jgi:SAM-dependent methyltransferase